MRSITVCLVLVLLSTICYPSTCASIPGQYEVMDTAEHPDTLQTEESHNPLTLFRSKRHSHLSVCSYCCNCCKQKKCAWCCLT
ncbi:hepcidin [Hyperolius riggenbachi]|uniref:hepcidin n=1 Tax=Hyperolius riggenbachi TaxID=752182 RepID=UPI0035A30B49